MSEREVQPYRHVLRDGRRYLVAFVTGREEGRLFRLDRIRDATRTTAPIGYEPRQFPHPSVEGRLATDFDRHESHRH